MTSLARSVVPPTLLSLLLLSPLVGTGCSSFVGEDPPLADSTFARVLVDLHMATARRDRSARMPPGVTDSVLAFHRVPQEDFAATLRYYTRHPDAFASLYDGVVDTLSALQNRAFERSRRPSLPDSIQQGPSTSVPGTP